MIKEKKWSGVFMKILITTDWYQPVINGVVTSVLNLKKELEKKGHEVRILTLSGNIHSRQEGNVTYIGSVGVGLVYPNARLKLALSHRYIQELILWKPDVIHSQCEFSTFFMARKIAQACQIPLIHTYHTVYEDFTHYFSPSVRFGKKIASMLSKKVLNKTQAVIAPTEKTANMLKRYHVKQSIYIVPTGLEMNRFQENKKPDRERLRQKLGFTENTKVFVYVGRLAKEKNIEELLGLLKMEQLSDLENLNKRTSDSDIKLLLVGDGPYREHLEYLVKELEMEHQVIFTGMVKPDEIAAYYRSGDIFISASKSETQGLTYIEAMACGLTVLCKKDECLNHVITPGVNGFVYENSKEFLRISEYLFQNKSYMQSIGEAARKSVQEHFSAEGFAAAVEEIYRKCLSEQSA